MFYYLHYQSKSRKLITDKWIWFCMPHKGAIFKMCHSQLVLNSYSAIIFNYDPLFTEWVFRRSRDSTITYISQEIKTKDDLGLSKSFKITKYTHYLEVSFVLKPFPLESHYFTFLVFIFFLLFFSRQDVTLAWNSERSSCFCHPSDGTRGLSHYTWLNRLF